MRLTCDSEPCDFVTTLKYRHSTEASNDLAAKLAKQQGHSTRLHTAEVVAKMNSFVISRMHFGEKTCLTVNVIKKS